MKNQVEQKLRDNMGTPPIAIDQDRPTFLMNTVIYPYLLSAYRAHLRPITSIFYANDREIIITSSIDCTIRLFTLTGRYIGFMGQSIPWGPLSSTIILKDLPKLIPEDICRKGSATTLELLRGDIGKRWKLLKHTIVAWTSLPIFRFFYQKQNPEIQQSLENTQEQLNIPIESKDSTITHIRKIDTEEKREWIQRRERLRQIIGLDRVDFLPIIKHTSVEGMLKTQRDNFGITMPVLGRFVRKYMQHRSRTNFDRIKIHGGKAIIYSLLPLASSPTGISQVTINSEEIPNDLLSDYYDIKLSRKEKVEQRIDGNLINHIHKDKLPKTKRFQDNQICASKFH